MSSPARGLPMPLWPIMKSPAVERLSWCLMSTRQWLLYPVLLIHHAQHATMDAGVHSIWATDAAPLTSHQELLLVSGGSGRSGTCLVFSFLIV